MARNHKYCPCAVRHSTPNGDLYLTTLPASSLVSGYNSTGPRISLGTFTYYHIKVLHGRNNSIGGRVKANLGSCSQVWRLQHHQQWYAQVGVGVGVGRGRGRGVGIFNNHSGQGIERKANKNKPTNPHDRRVEVILGLLHNLGDGCRGQNRGRDGRGTATGGPR